jgi:ribosome-binding factor A
MGARMRRIDEVLREVVSEGVASIKDPTLGFVTVTAVRTSPDLRAATVFVSVLGSQGDRTTAFEALERARVSIQRRVNDELRIKRTPVLTFEYDQTMEFGSRLTKLIDELELEMSDDPGD